MKNNVKMIVTDLDHTLLNNNRNISEYSKNILKQCFNNNIIIVYATARPIRATNIFSQTFKPHASICHNGAEILVNDNVIYQCGILPEIYNNIYKQISQKYQKCNFAIEADDKIYTNFDPSIYWVEMEYDNIKNIPNKNADKIIIGMEIIKNITEIEKYLTNDLYLEINHEKLILIMNKGATKWNAIKNYLNIIK
jgi:HAD superfamily hydrolase (TIGR01484 family)